jgi:hypothetical protein
MKRLLFLGLLLIRLPAGAIEYGSSRAAVLEELGEPNGSMQRDGTEILLFKTGAVTLRSNVVIKISLSQDYAQQAEERALKAKEFRMEKLVEQEKQKLLYPEDRVIQIGCTYSKTENWEMLPESIRPEPGSYGYDVYIPPGYHESDTRYYKCLFLEAPALWDSVKERVRKEKWVVVILHDASGSQIGKTMNGNFLAAFDDAIERFRISKTQLFIAGRVPSAIFATMRPVAGIILQEPDFKGFEKAGFTVDFLRKNPNLRAYVLLGNSNRDNVNVQAQFIISRIPKHYVGVYEGNTDVLPQPLADEALDWMKKEYSIP